MASEYHRLMKLQTVTASYTPPLSESIDCGAYKTLECNCQIPKVGTNGSVKLQHAAVNEEAAFRDLSGASWPLNGSGSHLSVANFLRYIRWVSDANVAGAPMALVDIVAKE